LTAIHHGRSLEELRDLRRPDGEAFLKAADELMALPPGNSGADAGTAAAWAEGIGNAGELAAGCSVDLGFERYRFPGFTVPKSHTPFSYLEELCHEGARRRYHPISSAVVRQLAHEMDVIERTGLAEFFLICWDIVRFARSRGIPAQGRGSAADSIVAYVLGITRVDPIRHHLLFERFINEGRTSYPDVDIDFSSERREEVIQYVYARYGPEHTGMVCNLVTYRARSAVREVGYALGFPRPLVDRVAKALETYDSVMVRRDLEADGGFGQFFAETVEREAAAEEISVRRAAEASGERGLTDRMGELNLPRGGRIVGEPPRARFLSDTNGGRAIRGSEPETGPRPALGGSDQPYPRSEPRVVAPSAGGVRGYHYHQAYTTETDPKGVRAARTEAEKSGGPGDSPASLALFAAERAASHVGREPHSSVARVQPRPETPAEARRGSTDGARSTAGMPEWERWLTFCGRIDGFPRHLSIHSGGMLVTAAPLIDIAPLERATMPDRVVVQFDKRDVETLKLIKLDLLGLGMLAAIDETLQLIEADCAACVDLDRLPEDVPEVFVMLQAADTVGVFQVESRAQMQTLPKSKPANLDDLVVEVAIIRPGPIQGNAVHPYLRRRQGLEPVAYLHPSLEP
ncbi:MAG TPA: hypothetical protein VF371_09015, partial [Candidatus Limnocylindrales bacterium]